MNKLWHNCLILIFCHLPLDLVILIWSIVLEKPHLWYENGQTFHTLFNKYYKFHKCYKSILFQIYVLSNTILQILFLHKYILKYDFFNNWLLYVLGCTIICKSIVKVLFILTWLKFENIKSKKKKTIFVTT